MADRYGLSVEPRRHLWNNYLVQNKLQPRALLLDGLHPNDECWRLMARIFADNFDRAVAAYRGERPKFEAVTVLSQPKAAGAKSYAFTGNRVEILADQPLDSSITATIDGHSAQEESGCWITSRSSRLSNVPDWPAIRKITVAPSVKREEHWTIRVTNLNVDQSNFRFSLSSDKGGADGDGYANRDFNSPSGRVSIKSTDWVIPSAYTHSKMKLPDGYAVSWSRDFVCHDQPPISIGPGNRKEVRHVIATGLSNGPHQMYIEVQPDAVSHIREIRVSRPPLLE